MLGVYKKPPQTFSSEHLCANDFHSFYGSHIHFAVIFGVCKNMNKWGIYSDFDITDDCGTFTAVYPRSSGNLKADCHYECVGRLKNWTKTTLHVLKATHVQTYSYVRYHELLVYKQWLPKNTPVSEESMRGTINLTKISFIGQDSRINNKDNY